MIGRRALVGAGQIASRAIFSDPLWTTRCSLGVKRHFSKSTNRSSSDLADREDISSHSNGYSHALAPVEEPSEEYLYKNKIIQEVVKEPLLETDGPSQEVKAKPDTPEKDKAFVQKKTTLWQKIKVALVHLKDSFVDVWKDTKYLTRVILNNGLKEEHYTLFEMRERRRITKDLIKFMPYAVLIILPGGELLFPPYFLLFPNSTPTQFMTVSNLGERTKLLTEKQKEGYENFVRSLPKFTKLIGIDPIKLYESLNYLDNTEGKEKDRQFYKAHDFEDKIQRFLNLKNKNELIGPIALKTLDSYELEQLNKIFYQLYVPGYTWINVIYGTFFKVPFIILKYLAKFLKVQNPSRMTNNVFMKINFTIDKGPLAYLKKYLLLAQLKFHIKQIRRQDRVLNKNFSQLSKNPILHKAEFAKQRAIDIDNQDEMLKFIEYYWLPLSLRKDVSDDLLVWITVLRFKYADILV